MSVSGIESLGAAGFTPLQPTTITTGTAGAPSGVQSATGTPGTSFSDLVLDGIDRLDGVQQHADQLAVQAATGQLTNLHDYTIAATEAQVTTQMTVAIRNKAVEAFNEIMRMQVG